MVGTTRRKEKDVPVDSLVEAAERQWLQLWVRGPREVAWSSLPPQVGDTAPSLLLADHTGAQVELADMWAQQPALLIFWRHFGCGCGLDRAERLRKEYDDYVAAGCNVVIVGQGEPERAADYRAAQELEATILCDPDEDAYRAYGLLEASVAQVLFDAPRDMWSHDRATGEEFQRQRRQIGRPLVDNPWRLPGEFVISDDGTVLHTHRYQHCESYPDPLVLMAAMSGGACLPEKENRMYSFECANVVPGCAGRVEGETEQDVLQKVAAHAAEAHDITEISPELADKVRAGIR